MTYIGAQLQNARFYVLFIRTAWLQFFFLSDYKSKMCSLEKIAYPLFFPERCTGAFYKLGLLIKKQIQTLGIMYSKFLHIYLTTLCCLVFCNLKCVSYLIYRLFTSKFLPFLCLEKPSLLNIKLNVDFFLAYFCMTFSQIRFSFFFFLPVNWLYTIITKLCILYYNLADKMKRL